MPAAGFGACRSPALVTTWPRIWEFHCPLGFNHLLEWLTALRKVLYLELTFYHKEYKPGSAKWREAWRDLRGLRPGASLSSGLILLPFSLWLPGKLTCISESRGFIGFLLPWHDWLNHGPQGRISSTEPSSSRRSGWWHVAQSQASNHLVGLSSVASPSWNKGPPGSHLFI